MLRQARESISTTDLVSYIYVAKMVLAIMVSYGLAALLPWTRTAWLLVSVVVVMGIHVSVGMQFKRAILRFCGTVVGALFGALGLLLKFHPVLQAIYVLLISSLLMLQTVWFGKWRYVGILSAVTFFVVLLAPGQDFMIAYQRTVEILLGIVIALLVTRYVFPMSAEVLARRIIHANWTEFIELIDAVFFHGVRRYDAKQRYESAETRIMSNLNEINEMHGVLSYEGNKHLKAQVMSCYRNQKAMLRYTNVLEMTLREYLDDQSAMSSDVTEILQSIATVMMTNIAHVRDQDAAVELVSMQALRKQLLSCETEHDEVLDCACSTLAFVSSRVQVMLKKNR